MKNLLMRRYVNLYEYPIQSKSHDVSLSEWYNKGNDRLLQNVRRILWNWDEKIKLGNI